MPITYFEATEDQAHHFVSLSKIMHAEGVYAFLPFDEEKMLDCVMRHIKESTSFAFLAFQEDECIGMHLGSLTSYFFSHERLSSSLVLYVIPSKRGSHAAMYLMDMFLNWSRYYDAVEVYIGVSIGVNLESTDKFLKHYGFKNHGGNYKYRHHKTGAL